MPSRSVNRCIAIAAHGRRCQQTTYRGSPYCWHHTQSRKVWAPSRMQASRGRQGAGVSVPIIDDGALDQPPAPMQDPRPDPVARIAAGLDLEQLEALAEFLEGDGPGVFRIDRAGGEIIAARTDPRLSRTLASRRSSLTPDA